MTTELEDTLAKLSNRQMDKIAELTIQRDVLLEAAKLVANNITNYEKWMPQLIIAIARVEGAVIS